jgi:hypothetical protein
MNKILILLIIIIIGWCLTKPAFFGFDKPIFMTREETIKYFIEDRDNYVKDLSDLDIISLKSTSKEDYVTKIVSDARDFTQKEKELLIKSCAEADKFLYNYKKIPEIDSKKISSMKWVISKTNGEWYESGYPHTRENIIFITDEVINHHELTRIMIHEKIHVFERLYPEEIEEWMKVNGYTKHSYLKDYPMARSNPDVNGIVYKSKEGCLTLAQFKNKNPSGIDDAHYPCGRDWKHEHPYETLAYTIDYDFAGETF